ncbi:MAG: hypothetical protein IKN54_02620, partial [Lachnospiraceae bacterium]|nr:hypothetical protein [Lachnospiraceae bacterium]
MNKRIGGKAGFIAGCVVAYLLVVGIVATAVQVPASIEKMKINKKISQSKVVLYEGPKSLKDATDEDIELASEKSRDITLKHSVNTKVYVNNQDCYVYETNVNNTHTWKDDYFPALDRTPVTYFDFEGTVRVTVEVPKTDIKSVTIRPLAYNIKPEIDTKKHTVSFVIDKPDSYTVEFNNNVRRAVHIFANPIEKNVPDKDDEDVLYIGPGEWNIENIMLEDNQTLYIAGGAVVHGIVNANFVKNVTVCGRGIIDGSLIKGWAGRTASIPLKFDNCSNVDVEGVISLNANAWCVQAYDTIGATF